MTAPDWLDSLHEAVDMAEVGFHFEEGGCFGMALAIHAALVEEGLAPRIVVYDDYRHTMVDLDGKLLDYTGAVFGEFDPLKLVVVEDVAGFIEAAAAGSSQDVETIGADRDLAAEIVVNAKELAEALLSLAPAG